MCEVLAESGVPTVRHHYFLSMTERDETVNSYVVEQSIEAQVKRLHPEVDATGRDLRASSKRAQPTTRLRASRSYWFWTARPCLAH